ncbi:MAG: hypothetical protein P1U42_08025 [Phycisphaerales bacterium]|nr:hypothetical protein [Phycisphaerales bacterium]
MNEQPTQNPGVDISNTPSPHSLKNRLLRVLWGFVQATLFRWSPRPCHRWRAFLLRSFGADVTMKSRVYPKAKVWGPWNLKMDDFATLADDVDCYCVDRISIGAHTTISQYSYLCGATHDFELVKRPLTPMPITIGEGVWIAADVFVGPGTTIGDHSVVGARSSVFTDLPAWKVCVGSPAKPIRDRVLRDAPDQELNVVSPTDVDGDVI